MWDCRAGKSPVRQINNAHDSDINVISWNSKRGKLIASGADDGSLKIWNLEMLGDDNIKPFFHFSWHKAPISSVEWDPNDDSTISVSSADNSVKFLLFF